MSDLKAINLSPTLVQLYATHLLSWGNQVLPGYGHTQDKGTQFRCRRGGRFTYSIVGNQTPLRWNSIG